MPFGIEERAGDAERGASRLGARKQEAAPQAVADFAEDLLEEERHVSRNVRGRGGSADAPKADGGSGDRRRDRARRERAANHDLLRRGAALSRVVRDRELIMRPRAIVVVQEGVPVLDEPSPKFQL
jgi:hypothetical protein